MSSIWKRLFGGRLFVVPDYQRGYAWETRQWNEFLEDIELLPEGKDHFTGTVVLHAVQNGQPRIDETGKQYAYFNIVDGEHASPRSCFYWTRFVIG